jgi:hypothetical protein
MSEARAGRERWLKVAAGISMSCCVAGVSRHVFAASEVMATGEETDAATSAPSPEVPLAPATRHGSVFVDPLGFLLFGPRIGLELGSARFSVAGQARWFNAGLLARGLFLNSGDTFGFSVSGGLRGRYYLHDGLSGTHLGVAVEYLHTRVEDASARIATSSNYLVPYGEAGYRLTFDRAYLDGSLGAGYAARLSGQVDNLPGGSSADLYLARNDSSVYATASLDLGIFF